jgi:hypothetical protein
MDNRRLEVAEDSNQLQDMLLAMLQYHLLVLWNILVVISITNHRGTLFFSFAEPLVPV